MKKHILITGSTDGIGKLVALQLAKNDHTVYLHGRSKEKLATVILETKKLSKNENIKGFVADFSDLNQVKQMALQINNEVSQLDILINNAGVYKSSPSHNSAGLDMRFVVNYFAPYILTNELMSLMNKGLEPRVLNLSSAAQSSISYKALLGEEKLSEEKNYAQSKLALTMWSFYLARQHQNIVVIAVNPGSLLNTKMVKEAFGNSWSSADKGADILYNLAILKEYQNSTGKYFDNDKGTFGKAHQDTYNEIEIDKLINSTNSLLHKIIS